MKKWLVLCALVLLPTLALVNRTNYAEDADTIRLAKVLYALGRDESYETKLALGTVVLNRTENGWFGTSLGDVLSQQQQFPAGNRYDEESLRAAHSVLTGTRVLKESALYYQPCDASALWEDEYLLCTIGSYRFYSEDGALA